MNNFAILKLAPRIAYRMAVPKISRVNLSLTYKCNHRCVSCDIWRHQDESKEELTFSDVVNLSNKNSLLWVSLTGGEPSLAQDFKLILDYCLMAFPLTNVISNGEATHTIVKAVKSALNASNNLLVIHLSLFSIEEAHDIMAGVRGSYWRVLDTMRQLKELNNPRLILGFEHMISSHNSESYAYVENLARIFKVGLTVCFEQNAGFYHNEEKTINKVNYPVLKSGLAPLDIFKKAFVKSTDKKIGCVAGQYSCWVTPDKNVYPCVFAIPDNPLFNLKNTNYSLDNKYFKDATFKNQCTGCNTPCEAYTTMLFRPWRML